jgi:Flp pilus assembly pilin Flp
LVRFADQNRLHGFSTETAMRVPPLFLRWIKTARLAAPAALKLIADNRGVTAIEYTLITVLIVMALVVLIERIGDFVSVPFETVAAKL